MRTQNSNLDRKKSGRPPLIMDYKAVEAAAASALSGVTIARALGIHRNTFHNLQRTDNLFQQAVSRGKARNNGLIELASKRAQPKPKRSVGRPKLQDRIDAALQLAQRGAFQIEIAQKLNVHRNSVSNWLRAHAPIYNQWKRQTQSEATLYYPYFGNSYGSESELLHAILKNVPKALPEVIRAEVCQEMAVDVLAGTLSMAELSSAWRRYVKAQYTLYDSKYRFVSLDSPAYGDETSNITWADVLVG